jgi:hypothetical protein
MASWEVHRGLGLPIHGFSRQNPALSYIFLKTPFSLTFARVVGKVASLQI